MFSHRGAGGRLAGKEVKQTKLWAKQEGLLSVQKPHRVVKAELSCHFKSLWGLLAGALLRLLRPKSVVPT